MTSHTRSLESVRSSVAKTLRPLIDFVKPRRNIILLILAIVLIALAVYLVTQLITYAYKDFFTCTHLVDDTLQTGTFCSGFAIPTEDFEIIPPIPTQNLTLDLKFWKPGIHKGGIFSGWTIPQNTLPLLPALEPVLVGPLEKIRRFVVWNTIFVFAVVSLILAFIVSKISGFVKLLITPEGRKAILTNISLWLLFFAILSGLFYFWVVVPSLGK